MLGEEGKNNRGAYREKLPCYVLSIKLTHIFSDKYFSIKPILRKSLISERKKLWIFL